MELIEKLKFYELQIKWEVSNKWVRLNLNKLKSIELINEWVIDRSKVSWIEINRLKWGKMQTALCYRCIRLGNLSRLSVFGTKENVFLENIFLENKLISNLCFLCFFFLPLFIILDQLNILAFYNLFI